MRDRIDKLLSEIEELEIKSKEHLEEFRLKYLAKKGILAAMFDDFKNVAVEERKEVGKRLNELKTKVQDRFNQLKEKFESTEETSSETDLTKPAEPIYFGSRHPISIVRNQIVEIFSRIGFTVKEDREIEDDWHNFSALNLPEDHPARDMQDTFFVKFQNPNNKSQIVLRTHTSSVQIRVMENSQPPIRSIFPGRVYRKENISARAHCFFHQAEGLYVDETVSFADLKQTLLYFAQEMFGENTKIRLRPSYFPFTEPSAEVDVTCFICGGKGCNICKGSGWVEILGCGMVHPKVLENCKIDSKKFTGFAFGMGIERIAMLKYQINDIRLFYENDIRFLEQFKSAL
ncbi:MAG: phenylalanine--tRNA ligase subunit alpha [Bacteroidetes bacterium]|nr:phenylalanine--tRNA ligase subunit alpha [Bacteroidota bacterium]